MKYIKIDKEKLEQEIADIEHVLSKFEQTGMLMTTALYATRNAYKNVLRSAILSEKRNDGEDNNQLKIEL
jgi:hypothetical protein